MRLRLWFLLLRTSYRHINHRLYLCETCCALNQSVSVVSRVNFNKTNSLATKRTNGRNHQQRKMATKLTLEDINSLPPIEFQHLFHNVVELWPAAAAAVSTKLPFGSVNELASHFQHYLDSIDNSSKILILQSHPDLACRLLNTNSLSVESANEQAAAGLNHLTPQQRLLLSDHNKQYRNKFGFPFVICVRQNNKIEKILDGISARLANDKQTEINLGINEVKKICFIRICDIVEFA